MGPKSKAIIEQAIAKARKTKLPVEFQLPRVPADDDWQPYLDGLRWLKSPSERLWVVYDPELTDKVALFVWLRAQRVARYDLRGRLPY